MYHNPKRLPTWTKIKEAALDEAYKYIEYIPQNSLMALEFFIESWWNHTKKVTDEQIVYKKNLQTLEQNGMNIRIPQEQPYDNDNGKIES
jgi:hypothetical protein